MFRSMLGGVFHDVNNWIATNVGPIGTTLIILMLSVLALLLLASLIKTATALKSPSLKINWWKLILLIVCVGLVVWLCTTYGAGA